MVLRSDRRILVMKINRIQTTQGHTRKDSCETVKGMGGGYLFITLEDERGASSAKMFVCAESSCDETLLSDAHAQALFAK